MYTVKSKIKNSIVHEFILIRILYFFLDLSLFFGLKKRILENVPKLREYHLELLEMIRNVILEHQESNFNDQY